MEGEGALKKPTHLPLGKEAPTNIGDLSKISEILLRCFQVKIVALVNYLCLIPTSAFYLTIEGRTDTWMLP